MNVTSTPPAAIQLAGSNVEPEWLIWRLVCEGVATLVEIETQWHLGDVLDANEALDAYASARARR